MSVIYSVLWHQSSCVVNFCGSFSTEQRARAWFKSLCRENEESVTNFTIMMSEIDEQALENSWSESMDAQREDKRRFYEERINALKKEEELEKEREKQKTIKHREQAHAAGRRDIMSSFLSYSKP